MQRGNTVVAAVWAPGVLSGGDAVVESIAAKDLTNLYRTSCYLRDKERYQAFPISDNPRPTSSDSTRADCSVVTRCH